METLVLEKVALPALGFIWENLSSALAASKDFQKTLLTPEAIHKDILGGHVQVWLLLDEVRKVDLVGLTRFEQYPEGSVLRIIWLHGRGDRQYLAAISTLERLAQKAGAVRLEIAGRPGWARVMRPLGYEEIYRVIGKDLTVETEH